MNKIRKRYRIWRDGYVGWEHYPYGHTPPPPSWWKVRPDLGEEKRNLKEHIIMLESELKTAKKDLKKLENISLN